MPRTYCVTMELIQRIGFQIHAEDDTEAMTAADHAYEELIQRPAAFAGGDMEASYELAEGDGRAVVPWTSPVAIEWPDGKAPPEDNWAPPPTGPDATHAYPVTVERHVLMAEWFDAADDAAAMENTSRITDRYNADPSRFDGGEASHDYAMDDPMGRTLVPWS